MKKRVCRKFKTTRKGRRCARYQKRPSRIRRREYIFINQAGLETRITIKGDREEEITDERAWAELARRTGLDNRAVLYGEYYLDEVLEFTF